MLDCNSKLDCFSGILPSARRMFSTVCCGILQQSNFTRFFRVMGYRRALLMYGASLQSEKRKDFPSQLEASDSQLSQDLLKPVSDANKAAFEAGSIAAGCCRGWNWSCWAWPQALHASHFSPLDQERALCLYRYLLSARARAWRIFRALRKFSVFSVIHTLHQKEKLTQLGGTLDKILEALEFEDVWSDLGSGSTFHNSVLFGEFKDLEQPISSNFFEPVKTC